MTSTSHTRATQSFTGAAQPLWPPMNQSAHVAARPQRGVHGDDSRTQYALEAACVRQRGDSHEKDVGTTKTSLTLWPGHCDESLPQKLTPSIQGERLQMDPRSARRLRSGRVRMHQGMRAGLKGSAYLTACVAGAAMVTILYKMAGYSWLMKSFEHDTRSLQEHPQALVKLALQNLAAMQDVMVPMSVFVGACFATFGLLICHEKEDLIVANLLKLPPQPLNDKECKNN